jgi:hypothetical protein
LANLRININLNSEEYKIMKCEWCGNNDNDDIIYIYIYIYIYIFTVNNILCVPPKYCNLIKYKMYESKIKIQVLILKIYVLILITHLLH